MSLLDTASLIVTPNAYKEGKLYSVIPSDGSGDMSVTRATTATRVNSQGLVELVPYNLLSYSEQFDNAWWKKSNTTVTANVTTAPNGTLTADRIVSSAGSNSYLYRLLDWTIGDTYTLSFYVKADSPQTIRLYGFGNSVDLDVTTEWTRLSMTFTANSASKDAGIRGNSLNTNFDIYLWGAQLVEGTSALDYQKTETRLNIPRLDYSNGTCPSLLVEPQRTNRVLYSQQFDDATWQKGPFNTIIHNAIISPDGIQNADKIQSSVSGTQIRYTNQAISSATGTYSIYMKAGEQTQCLMYLGGGANDGIFWNLTNGTFISYHGSGSVITYYSSEDVGNGWFRYTISSSSAFSYAEIYMSVNQVLGSNIPVGNGFYLWGAQCEIGSYATSYIPTTSASVTRNADVISKTGISSLIGQTEGTLYAEVLQMGASAIVPFQISDTTNNNRAQIEMSNNGAAICVVTSGGVNTAIITGSNLPYNQYHKIAVTYKANEFKLYVNGSLVGTDTSGAVPISPSAVYIGSESGSSFAGFKMKSAIHWKEVLTADQLEALTGTSFNTYAEMASYYNYTLQ
jgi:hypothetical protein